MNKRRLGGKAEEVAVNYLKEKNFKVIEKNYNCKLGEIDIIAENEGYLVFIEVKYRKTMEFGHPIEAVTYNKQKVIRKVAQIYMKHKGHLYVPCRFDVVGILGGLNYPEITHIKNAF